LFRLGFVPITLLTCLLTLPGCAIFGDVLHTPTVRVTNMRSVWITPDHWKMSVQLKVENKNPLTLTFSRATYTISIMEKQIQTKIITDLPVIPGYEMRMIEIPIQLSTNVLQAVLSDRQALSINLSGELYPTGKWKHSPLPYFYQTKIPIPKIPSFVFKQLKSVKKIKGYAFLFRTKNQNALPISIQKISGFIQINKRKFKILPLQKPIKLKPEETKVIALVVRNLPIQLLRKNKKFSLAGEVEADSAIGRMIIPLSQEISY